MKMLRKMKRTYFVWTALRVFVLTVYRPILLTASYRYLFFSFFFKIKFTRISFNSLRDIYIHTYICMELISFLFVCYNVIQIRRYVYHDVLRLDDAEKLMDCDFVQVSWRQQTIYELIWEFQGFYLIVNFSFFFLFLMFWKSYTTNQAKVVFLNQRPQTKTGRGSNHICFICERALQERYLFCSLSCKVYIQNYSFEEKTLVHSFIN